MSSTKKSKIFGETSFTTNDCFDYLEIEKDQSLIIVFRSSGQLNQKVDQCKNININVNDLRDINEIIIIVDFQNFNQKLNIDTLSSLVNNLWIHVKKINEKDKDLFLSLTIQNCLIEEIKPINIINLKLKKLEISDELYNISNNIGTLFPDSNYFKNNLKDLKDSKDLKDLKGLEVTELVLKKFKFNSRPQLKNFCEFIVRVNCHKLVLDDIFIELIIKEKEDDQDYKDLDIYISLIGNYICLNNTISISINSLTLRDCPLFAIIDNIFTEENEDSKKNKYIDIDENSLINPSIITKFKIDKKNFDICFDLDSFKLKFEENLDDNNNTENDFIDYLTYFFNIFVSFTTDEQKIKINENEDGVGVIHRQYLRKLTFKNFDVTKLEFITDDDLTFIEEKNWVLDSRERVKKEKWENFENKLQKFFQKFDKQTLSNVKELIFDNCSNFFIKWIIKFIGKDDFDLIKIKKCGKEYVNLENILTKKIKKLVLFDSPLIIGSNFPENNSNHLNAIEKLGYVNNLDIKINELDYYGKDFNLNTYKTYEILVELIKNKNFNENLTFEFNALANIMTFLAFKTYYKNQNFFNDPNDEEKGNDENIDKKDNLKGQLDETDIIKEIPKFLPKYIFFSSKKKRDFIYKESFCLKVFDKNSKITLKNVTIKKTTENFDNQNFLTVYKLVEKGEDISRYNCNTKIKKITYGSDGFYIDRDYKNFFNENNIGKVELINVTFSNYKDSNLNEYEREGILNLISNDEIERKSKLYKEMTFPNYTIDAKTLNMILYKNFLFEDFGLMFRYYIYKVNDNPNETKVSQDNLEKIQKMSDYFKTFKTIFDTFQSIGKTMTIIVTNLKELKEISCTLLFLRFLKKSNVNVAENNNIKSNEKKISMPNKSEIEKVIKGYFLKEIDESNNYVYSKMNYYYTSDDEKEIISKGFVIDNFTYNIQIENENIINY